MSEISHTPTSTFVPALDYPPALAKQVAAYEAAHEKWRAAYLAVSAAEADLLNAPAKDAQALVDAAAAGKPHPGEKHVDAARKALAVAEEQCRVAREAATAQTDTTRATFSGTTDELLSLVIANARTAAAQYEAVLTDCQAREERARAEMGAASSAVRVVLPFLSEHYGLDAVWSGGGAIPAPTWPTHSGAPFEARLKRLEERVEQARRGRAATAARSSAEVPA